MTTKDYTIIGASVVGVLVVLLIFFLGYQEMVIQPEKERQHELEMLELEQSAKEEEEARRRLLEQACMNDAYTTYSLRWESKCELEGLGPDCSLMQYQRADIEDDYEAEKDRCVTRFK